MKLTPAEANKLLRKLNNDRDKLFEMERQSMTFVAATVENPDDARPEYSYEETRKKLNELDLQVRTVKHELNRFNVTTMLPDFGMTIDQALVYIPQLSQQIRRLADMRLVPKKTRNTSMRASNLIEYTYANFDPEQAETDYSGLSDELARLQNALDLINSTAQIEIDL